MINVCIWILSGKVAIISTWWLRSSFVWCCIWLLPAKVAVISRWWLRSSSVWCCAWLFYWRCRLWLCYWLFYWRCRLWLFYWRCLCWCAIVFWLLILFNHSTSFWTYKSVNFSAAIFLKSLYCFFSCWSKDSINFVACHT